MGLFVPAPAEGRTLDAVFAEKIPAINDESDERWLVGANILAYLKWLIFTAAFKDPNAEPRASIHSKFFKDWRRTFRASEDIIRKKLKKQLEFWYSKHPPTKKGFYIRDDNAGAGDGEQLRIYHDDDDDNERAAVPQLQEGQGEGGVGN